MKKIIVIGGGAAGMMAAISAAELSKNVVLLEKTNFLGKKLSITGKGRCNITNSADIPEIIENICWRRLSARDYQGSEAIAFLFYLD